MGGRGGASRSRNNGGLQRTHMKRLGTPPPREQQVAAQLNVSESEARSMIQAVESYSGSGYGSIRRAQYNNEVGTTAYEKAEQIESYIEKSPKWGGGELYRGINVSSSVADQLEAGAVIDMRGMSSWSTSRSVADDFASGGQQCVIFKSAKTNKGASITHLSHFGTSEQEVLVSGKATWTIQSVSYDSSGTKIVTVKEN